MSNILVGGSEKPRLPTRHPHCWQGFALISMLLTCAGCWEEIPYEPTQQVSVASTPSAVPTQDPREPKPDILPQEEPEPSPSAAELDTVDSPPTQPTTPPVVVQPVADEPPAELEEPEPTSPLLDEHPEAVVATPEDDLDWLNPPIEIEAAAEESSEETTGEEPVEAIVEPKPPASPRTALAVWQTSSRWSLAAAYFAKGLGVDRYGDLLEQAKHASELLAINLPDFSKFNEGSTRQAKIAAFLIEQSGPQLVGQVAKNYHGDSAALAELAIKTHALLLVYTPLNEELDTIVIAIRTSAERSTLPAEIWQPIVDLLERRESFQDIKQAVFQLHEQAAAHLSRQVAEQ